MTFDGNKYGAWRRSDVTRRIARSRRWTLVVIYVLVPLIAAGVTFLVLWALGL